jgi:hypothetical protein
LNAEIAEHAEKCLYKTLSAVSAVSAFDLPLGPGRVVEREEEYA